MRFLGLAVLLFLGCEVLSVAWMAKSVGALGVLGLMVLGFVIGSRLLRGMADLSQVMVLGELARGGGRMSFYQMLWPLRIPLAGMLLMLPGFFSDFLALLLLVPFRGGKTVHTQRTAGAAPHSGGGAGTREGDIIEGDFVVKDGKGQPENNAVKTIGHKKD